MADLAPPDLTDQYPRAERPDWQDPLWSTFARIFNAIGTAAFGSTYYVPLSLRLEMTERVWGVVGPLLAHPTRPAEDTLRFALSDAMRRAVDAAAGASPVVSTPLRQKTPINLPLEVLIDAAMGTVKQLLGNLDGADRRFAVDTRIHIGIIQRLREALGLDPDDGDSCLPGCDAGAAGAEHMIWHLVRQRDEARAERDQERRDADHYARQHARMGEVLAERDGLRAERDEARARARALEEAAGARAENEWAVQGPIQAPMADGGKWTTHPFYRRDHAERAPALADGEVVSRVVLASEWKPVNAPVESYGHVHDRDENGNCRNCDAGPPTDLPEPKVAPRDEPEAAVDEPRADRSA